MLPTLFDFFYFLNLAAGVPIKLLHEGEGHIVTVELKSGEIYKGLLIEAEDTMNCQMKEGSLFYCSIFLDLLLLLLLL